MNQVIIYSVLSFSLAFTSVIRKEHLQQTNIIIYGPPGAGKGTQANKISEVIKLCHLSSGQLIRDVIASNQSELSTSLKDLVDAGELIPDEIITKLLSSKIDSIECINGTIFDGYPRNINQSITLDEILNDRNSKLTAAIELEIPDDVLIRRVSGRLFHQASGRTYHVDFNPPKVSMTDDVTGETLSQRDDDKPDVIRQRISVYKEQAGPLAAFYESKGILRRVNGTGDVNSVFNEVWNALELTQFN
ncbi:CLUMA_CG015772, isoform A [Clunio marinus]|uniref:CLUMA_CG015772, isoform A n=1 Tax=Clunio marinus TaxID=568069 RepID=A0A1J1IRM3_9DIPT|nr:CLUMA_CG015772, isoform A [Clunio marinus]